MTSHNPGAAGLHNPHETGIGNNGIAATNYYGNGHNTDAHTNNTMDDVWGSNDDDHHHYSQPYPHHHNHTQTQQPQAYYQPSHYHSHPQPPLVSDIPRLSAAHSNAGYRDGITLAKARTAQQGFDEGYGLGATVGARAGQLLGVLEGLAAAVGLHSLSRGQRPRSQGKRMGGQNGGGGSGRRHTVSGLGRNVGGGQGMVKDEEGEEEESEEEEEARRISELLSEARRELSVVGVFDRQYWADDGTWRYEVSAPDGSSNNGYYRGMEEGGLVVFADVAEAHPLLRKWDGIVRAEAARYGVDWEILKDDMGGDGRRETGDEEREREARMRRDRSGAQPAAREREALAW
ncbi:hypothetical protein B0J18DRAFT_450838 [Chaetomium sp. MPI-SDFR-AT-0129]|nr:hypothetical protein B0J18DRAFT_450838 [Chaetomium sp. MPI-SDFR-AT-0129]